MNSENKICYVCNEPANVKKGGDFADVACVDCGEYRITGTAIETLPNLDIDNRKAVLERARATATKSGEKPTINSGML